MLIYLYRFNEEYVNLLIVIRKNKVLDNLIGHFCHTLKNDIE